MNYKIGDTVLIVGNELAKIVNINKMKYDVMTENDIKITIPDDYIKRKINDQYIDVKLKYQHIKTILDIAIGIMYEGGINHSHEKEAILKLFNGLTKEDQNELLNIFCGDYKELIENCES